MDTVDRLAALPWPWILFGCLMVVVITVISVYARSIKTTVTITEEPAENEEAIGKSNKRLPMAVQMIGGLILPAWFAASGIWYGYIEKNIELRITNIYTRHRPHYHNDPAAFTGDAAEWLGTSIISLGFALFTMLFLSQRGAACTWMLLGVLALLFSFGSFIAAWASLLLRTPSP